MTNLLELSTALADLVAAAAPCVVQVQGVKRPVSGVTHGDRTVLTSVRAIGREDGRVRVVPAGAEPLEAELAGWDPATGLAVLRTAAPLGVAAPVIVDEEPRPGEVVVAIGRSWSNATTASVGNVAIVGGPLRTGRRREIARVFRITAPVHDGFAGGGLFNASGRLIGIATASAIRGFTIGIPASIAWTAASRVLENGSPRRGFIGVAVQPVVLPERQRPGGRDRALLVMNVSPSSPAEQAGLLVGDMLLELDGEATAAPEDLLDLLTEKRVGRTVKLRILRGGAEHHAELTVAGRARRQP